MKKPVYTTDYNQPRQIVVILLWGTTAVLVLLTLLLCHSFLSGNTYVLSRIGVAVIALLYSGTAWLIFIKGRTHAASIMLVALYLLLPGLVAFEWGINTAAGILLFGFIIMIAGALLGSRFIIPTMLSVVVILCGLQAATYAGLTHTDETLFQKASTFADVAGYCVMLAIFGLVAWLASRRMEQSLDRALKAERNLAREKKMLSIRLENKTREVREAQLEEMRQLYRFAELGQLGAVLLHDLANNLTSLTLDIDGLGRRLQRNESITRAKESIAYLETMVNGVRRQITERDKPVVFDAMRAILETVVALGPKARRNDITIEYAPKTKRPFHTTGDPVRLAHILTILISNAIDAYDSADKNPRPVIVTARIHGGALQVHVTDYGKGIAGEDRDRIFKPFSSTKPDGMGIGLYMAREMTEQHFKGTLVIGESAGKTTFVLELPRSTKRKRRS